MPSVLEGTILDEPVALSELVLAVAVLSMFKTPMKLFPITRIVTERGTEIGVL